MRLKNFEAVKRQPSPNGDALSVGDSIQVEVDSDGTPLIPYWSRRLLKGDIKPVSEKPANKKEVAK